MDVSYEWFENLCASLSRNPVQATQTLEKFRESEVAVDACLFFLNVPTISHIATFQAVSILQRTSIARWQILTAEKKVEIRSKLVELLTRTMDGTAPSYLLNKLMQVTASVWKRGWLEMGSEEKGAYFQFIQGLMENPSTSKSATVFLRITLEEFGQQSFAEINMQFTFHADVKRVFQRQDLINVFNLAVHPLAILFSWQDAASIAPHVPLMTELFKLLSELSAWNFRDDTLNTKSNVDDNSMQAHQCNKLPAEWSEALVKSNFVVNLFGMYQALCANPQSFGTDNNILQACALELRNLILCLPTIDGEIFSSETEKLQYGNNILECSIRLVQNVVTRTESSPLQVSDHAPDYETGGFRHEQMELFVTMFLRMCGNYKIALLSRLPQFESVMLMLGRVTLETVKELASLSQLAMQGYEQWLNNAPSAIQQYGSVGVYPPPCEIPLMSTWRGDILALCLDAWSVVLLHPSIVAPGNASLQGTGTPNSVSAQFATWMRNISTEIFTFAFQAVFLTLIVETLSGAEVEENEEDALIESRETADLLVGISTLGRANFPASLKHLYEVLQNSVNDLHSLAQQNASELSQNPVLQMRCLQALEKCRVCVEFTSYLCIDNFHENVDLMTQETPIINELIIQQLTAEPALTAQLFESVTQIAQLLQWETQLIVHSCGSSTTQNNHFMHPLQSPLLLHAAYRFVREFVLRYMDSDPALYTDQTVAAAGQAFHAFHGTELNVVLDVVLSCTAQLITYLPLESELIGAAAQTLVALSASQNGTRLAYIVNHASVGNIAQYVTSVSTSGGGNSGGQSNSGCRLNASGFVAMYESLAMIFVRSGHEAYFTHLCGSVYGLVEGKAEVLNRNLFQRVISSLCGLAKCVAGQDRTLYGLFDAVWPVLRASIRQYVDADDILKQYLLLLRLYAEHQLTRLPSASCLALYQTSFEVLSIYQRRFSLLEQRSEAADEEAILFRNESCLHVLELLNHLSSKDFSFTEDCAESSNATFEAEVAQVLLCGLQVILPILSTESLRSFPLTAERFFSFLAFMASSYVVDIARWLNSLPGNEGSQLLQEILHRLHCGCGAVEAPTARLALQALQAFATHQWKCRAQQMPHQSNVPFACAEVLAQALDTLLLTILTSGSVTSIGAAGSGAAAGTAAGVGAGGGDGALGNNNSNVTPTTASALLAWDRIDSLGNTLVTFIALENARFTQSAQYLVSLQAPSVQPTLLHCLTQLSTARGVSLQTIDKPNRQKFLLNFREFVTQIKSLSLV